MAQLKIIRADDVKPQNLRGLPAEAGQIKRVIVTEKLHVNVDEVSPGHSPHHWHRHTKYTAEGAEVEYAADFEEIYFVLSGRGVMQWKSESGEVQEQEVGPGDTIHMHGLECGYDFNKHLHNGDSLSAATVRVPAGRPPGWVAGSPWEQSAVDALKLKKLDQVKDWSLARVLYVLEGYNGFGYRTKGIRSPYLWSFSNLYEKGKYVADHQFDPNAISKQVGSATLLKMLGESGFWP